MKNSFSHIKNALSVFRIKNNEGTFLQMENKILKNFIVFEGIDGSGTTTQLKELASRFDEKKVFITAEPTSKETGLFLRKMLKGDFKVSEKTASYLFAADRCEHIFGDGGIIEQIQNGKIVLCDRYFFSSLAYQSVSCGKELPALLNSQFPLPQILFYFKIDAELSLSRVTSRGKAKEIYEKIDFQKKTAALYEQVMDEYKGSAGSGMKLIQIDASKSIDEIKDFIWKEIQNTLKI